MGWSAVTGQPDLAVAGRVAAALQAGGLVGLPTETVYGLAADAQDTSAVARIFATKARPADHPLIVHVADAAALIHWSAAPSPAAQLLAAAFWPGPLTVVVPRSARAADLITGGQPTVALRCPGHPVALACLKALADLTADPGRGVAAPSANLFGRVSPTSAADVLAELGPRLDPDGDLIVDGGECAVGLESTIVDCTGGRARILRPGAISQEQVDAVLAEVSPGMTHYASSDGTPAPAMPSDEPRVPGSLESHYAPAAVVALVERGDDLPLHLASAGLIAPEPVGTPAGWVRLAGPGDAAQYAHDLYRALRSADVLGLPVVVAVLPPVGWGPLALAVRDRLGRAAGAA